MKKTRVVSSVENLLAFLVNVNPQWVILLSALVLLGFGVIMVASASMDISYSLYQDSFYFLKRHLVYLVLGLISAVLLYRTPLDVLQRSGGVLFIIGLVLLLLVLIPGIGRKVNGSSRWLHLGPVTLQASELVKFFVLIYLSGYLVRKQAEVRQFWIGFLKPLALLLVLLVLLLMEPDFGSAVVVTATVMGMIFLSGAKLGQFLLLAAVFLVSAVFLVVLEPYRWQRFIAFTDPWADQYNSGYQLSQSLIAFGRGEWFGVGLGESVQKLFYLPEAHTDFVFAVLAEELGLFGVWIVIITMTILVLASFNLGRKAAEAGYDYGAYLCYGAGLWLGLQSAINIGVNMGLLPTKGLTLPLVSYGGTSLIISLMLIALLMRIALEVEQRGGARSKHAVNHPFPERRRIVRPSASRLRYGNLNKVMPV